MNLRTLVLAALLLAAGWSKITQENFARINDGMSEQEVHAILGAPTESSSVSVRGLSGTSSKWIAQEMVITVQFVNGKVMLRSLAKPPGK